MGIRETIQGWLKQDRDKDEGLRDAAIDEASEEYGEYRGDVGTQSRMLGREGEFEDDQQAPRPY